MEMGRNGATPGEALVLFDIDGTLIRKAGPHHREALVEACRVVMGLATSTDHIPVQGMLDRVILERMLRDAGAAPASIRRAMPDLVRRAQSIYVRSCPASLESKVCPGVRGLLARLRRRGVFTGLVTGNLSRIGWKKMERAGLKQYFRFGAFAESALDRAALVGEAVGHARDRGWIGSTSRLWYIGDHPNDIRAARENRVRSVAVATGLSSAEELSAHGPDLLVDDLRALKLEMLLES
jgi:phosphoglycolate phosphatase-like HAD superfamily hydrolase